MKKTTAQNLARLKVLAAEATGNLYERLKVATAVLEDLDWIATVHGGSDLRAMDALSQEYFVDLGGFLSLGKLVQLYKTIPQTEWAELRYNVAAVESLYDDRHRETHEKGERTSWKSIAEQRGQELDELRKQVKQLFDENGTLRTTNDDLKVRVAHLEGRIEELQRREAA